jgi:glycosyltransferase involved in cell wall biosynthesis
MIASSSKTRKPTVVSVIGVNASFIGGMQYWSRELSTVLQNLGWNSVLCFATPPSDDVKEFLNLPNVSFEVLDKSWELAATPAKGLHQILKRHRPDILHLHFTGFIGVYPWLARYHGAKKIFFTDQASRPEGFIPQRKPLWRRAATRMLNWPINEVFCVSDYGHEALEALDVFPASRIRTVYNSIDFDRYDSVTPDGMEFRRKYGIPEDRRVVAQVSWIIPDKGIEDLLEAARIVLPQFPSAHFTFIGEGKFRDEYAARARDYGIGDHVTWTGMVRDPLIEGAFASADIFCQMSRWEEVFGWVIAEAMAHSKPLVATRVGGIPEVVQDGQSGFLVNRRDPAAMAERILTLLKDPDLCERMGKRGRQIAREKFDLKNNVAQVVKSYGLSV